ncbi:MAG: XdhC family protein [Proteobacteria bacterium]|nr:XdhC family protein [Pseudomonadota bacterium]
MTPALLAEVLAARAARRPVAVITDLASGQQRIVAREAAADDELAAILDKAFRFDKSGVEQTEKGEVFVTVHNPPLRLVVTGAVLIAQALIPMARAVGYDIWVVDPRGAFATGARFPDIHLHAEWPDEIIPKIGLDQRTAFIALTHDPKIDDPALDLALKSDVFYIGALGSKKTQAARLDRLRAAGFSDNQLSRINGPIGLPIGAVGAPEIAVSILAEMTRALRLG